MRPQGVGIYPFQWDATVYEIKVDKQTTWATFPSMNMKLKLEITADDITHGARMDCRACPIARAIHRAAFNALFGTDGFDGRLEAIAKHSKLRVTVRVGPLDNPEFIDYSVATPASCLQFMRRFDAGFTVEPFTIEVDFL